MPPGFRLLAWSALVLAPACKGEPAAAVAPPPPATAVTVLDAAPPPPDGITAIAPFDPSSGLHLDDDTPNAHRGSGTSVHTHRTLEILLQSTPSGATAAVDGVIVGPTPGYWEGDFTGREREFTFVKPGYAMARYRFVPITNGVVHGRLTKIVVDPETGTPAIPSGSGGPAQAPPAPPAPPRSPDAAPAPVPPTPPDAAAAPQSFNPGGVFADAGAPPP